MVEYLPVSGVVFVRVRDKSTGHELDVPESVAADEAAYQILADYPPNDTGQPRPAKHRISKAGASAATKASTKEK